MMTSNVSSRFKYMSSGAILIIVAVAVPKKVIICYSNIFLTTSCSCLAAFLFIIIVTATEKIKIFLLFCDLFVRLGL